MRQQLYRRLHQAYACGALRLVKRIQALLAIADGLTVSDVANQLALGEQTVRDYLNSFLCGASPVSCISGLQDGPASSPKHKARPCAP
jgi:hypothetical protein